MGVMGGLTEPPAESVFACFPSAPPPPPVRPARPRWSALRDAPSRPGVAHAPAPAPAPAPLDPPDVVALGGGSGARPGVDTAVAFADPFGGLRDGGESSSRASAASTTRADDPDPVLAASPSPEAQSSSGGGRTIELRLLPVRLWECEPLPLGERRGTDPNDRWRSLASAGDMRPNTSRALPRKRVSCDGPNSSSSSRSIEPSDSLLLSRDS